jgi:hypothetical protein
MAGSGVMSDDYRQDLEEESNLTRVWEKLEEGFTSKLAGLKSNGLFVARTTSLGPE